MLTGAVGQFAAKGMEEFVEKHLPAPKRPKLVGGAYVALAAGEPTLDTDSKGVISCARDGATVGQYIFTCNASLGLKANTYLVGAEYWLNSISAGSIRFINTVYLNDNVFKVVIRDGTGSVVDITGGMMVTITKYT
jgi:hypothetical protein